MHEHVPNVVNGEDGSGDEPGDAEDGVDDDTQRHQQQVQVVPASLLQYTENIILFLCCNL